MTVIAPAAPVAAALAPVEPPAPPARSITVAELAAARIQDADLPMAVANRAAEVGSPGAMGDRILDTVAQMRQRHQVEAQGLTATTLADQPPAAAAGPAAAPLGDAAGLSERFTTAMTRIVQFNASMLQFSVASSAVSSAGHSFNQFIRGQ